MLDWGVATVVISKQTVKASRNPPPIGQFSLVRTDNPSPVQLTATALLDQRLGLREVGGILDPEFEVTGAIVADAANVTAESLAGPAVRYSSNETSSITLSSKVSLTDTPTSYSTMASDVQVGRPASHGSDIQRAPKAKRV